MRAKALPQPASLVDIPQVRGAAQISPAKTARVFAEYHGATTTCSTPIDLRTHQSQRKTVKFVLINRKEVEAFVDQDKLKQAELNSMIGCVEM